MSDISSRRSTTRPARFRSQLLDYGVRDGGRETIEVRVLEAVVAGGVALHVGESGLLGVGGGGSQAPGAAVPYIWPAELELVARLVGFELETRHADWAGAEFTAEFPLRISIDRRSTASVSQRQLASACSALRVTRRRKHPGIPAWAV